MGITKKCIVSMIAALVVLLAAGSAFADGEGTVSSAKKQTRLMSLSLNPILLAFPDGPLYQLTGEFKAHDNWGVAVVGGGGAMTTEDGFDYTRWELGGQLDYYVLGNFDHGMQLGAQVLYQSADAEVSDGAISAQATASGVRAGPFIGYKIITDIGFTFNGQLGAAVDTASGEGTASSSETGVEVTAEDSDSALVPLLRLNVGWSF
jgi:hypothetical protein